MSEPAASEVAEQAPVQQPPREPKRKRRMIIFGIVTLVNVGLLALLVSQLLTPAPKAAVRDPLIGHAAPDFSLALLTPTGGQTTLSLADLKGKPVVLNFWASWCAPCKEEMPLLEQTWEQLQGQGKDIAFVGIDFQESDSDAASFLAQHHVTYPIVLDTSGEVTLNYNITGLPQTVFIDGQGRVVNRVTGELTSKTLANGLNLIV